jgi:hypothetical protein
MSHGQAATLGKKFAVPHKIDPVVAERVRRKWFLDEDNRANFGSAK